MFGCMIHVRKLVPFLRCQHFYTQNKTLDRFKRYIFMTLTWAEALEQRLLQTEHRLRRLQNAGQLSTCCEACMCWISQMLASRKDTRVFQWFWFSYRIHLTSSPFIDLRRPPGVVIGWFSFPSLSLQLCIDRFQNIQQYKAVKTSACKHQRQEDPLDCVERLRGNCVSLVTKKQGKLYFFMGNRMTTRKCLLDHWFEVGFEDVLPSMTKEKKKCGVRSFGPQTPFFQTSIRNRKVTVSERTWRSGKKLTVNFAK